MTSCDSLRPPFARFGTLRAYTCFAHHEMDYPMVLICQGSMGSQWVMIGWWVLSLGASE